MVSLRKFQSLDMTRLAEIQDWPVRLCMAYCVGSHALLGKRLLQRSSINFMISRSKKRWMQRGKSVNGILAEIKDGDDLPESCSLLLFDCRLASHFPERLSVGLITAGCKSGNRSDMSASQSVL